MGSSAAATCTSAWVSTPPVMARFHACLYDGHSHPFLRLRDGTHPLAVGPVKPWPLIQARQIRPAAPVGARKTWDPADRSFRKTTRAASAESEVRPGPRLPTLRAHAQSRSGKPGRKHYPHSPCRIFAEPMRGIWMLVSAQIILFGGPFGRCPWGDQQAPGVMQLSDGPGVGRPAVDGLRGQRTRARRNVPVCSVAWAASGVPSMIG